MCPPCRRRLASGKSWQDPDPCSAASSCPFLSPCPASTCAGMCSARALASDSRSLSSGLVRDHARRHAVLRPHREATAMVRQREGRVGPEPRTRAPDVARRFAIRSTKKCLEWRPARRCMFERIARVGEGSLSHTRWGAGARAAPVATVANAENVVSSSDGVSLAFQASEARAT
jgi:hypothetical protein